MTPQHVVVDGGLSNFWAIAGVALSAGAVVVASVAIVVTIYITRRQRIDASIAAREERRIDFELTVLGEIGDYLAIDQGADVHIPARLRLLPADDLPLLRAWNAIGDRQPFIDEVQAINRVPTGERLAARRAMLERQRSEVADAIRERLERRPGTPTASPSWWRWLSKR